MACSGLGIALGHRCTAAKEHQIDPREIECVDRAYLDFAIRGARLRADIPGILERMQLGIFDFARPDLVDHRLPDQAGGADHGDAQGRGDGVHGRAMMFGVPDTTSAHCARWRRW